jgi:DNA-binding MarR family transcriptional regulator
LKKKGIFPKKGHGEGKGNKEGKDILPEKTLNQKLFFHTLKSPFLLVFRGFRFFMNTPSSTGSNVLQDLPRLIERMHRRFLDVVRIELTRQGINDISPVQVMMLANIGEEEISVRDLIERGYYLGSNASYNLKNLVEGGYVDRQASERDRRAARLKLSDKGRTILEALSHLNTQMAEPLVKQEAEKNDFEISYRTLRRLERRWSDSVRFTGDQGGGDF